MKKKPVFKLDSEEKELSDSFDRGEWKSVMSTQKTSEQEACTKRHYEITYADLPLSCPTKDMRVWDAHPRVYLPIEQVGRVQCSYCSAVYTLKDFVPPEKPLIED